MARARLRARRSLFAMPMIVGSGLIATAFARHAAAHERVCFYAAGVSNSSCCDPREFERDRLRLQQHLAGVAAEVLFVYFSTCSVEDPWSKAGAYAQHKLALEGLVRQRGNYLVFRLPQVAGRTPNPHTILNYLHARITRSERFVVWRQAARNIIDARDVVRIAMDLIDNEGARNETINIANPRNSSLPEIVAALESTTGHRAIYDVVDRGGEYMIDTSRIAASIRRCGVAFDDAYLSKTLAKYYD